MLRLYHAFLGLRNRPQPLTGKGCLLHKQKILTALLMGPSGSASPLRAAFRRVIALRAKGCAAHMVTLLTGQIRRLTKCVSGSVGADRGPPGVEHVRSLRGRMCGARGHLAHRSLPPPNIKPLRSSGRGLQPVHTCVVFWVVMGSGRASSAPTGDVALSGLWRWVEHVRPLRKPTVHVTRMNHVP